MKKLLLMIILFLPVQLSHANEPIEQLKNFLAQSKTFSSKFKQIIYDKHHNIKQTAHGLFFLSRPGKFRWSYHKPFVQEIVSHSGKVWFYDEDLEQVTIKKLDKSMGSTPALLLSGNVDIEKRFRLEDQGKGDGKGLSWIKLTPKDQESNFKSILIGLDQGRLGGMELNDNFGQLTRIYFSKSKINPPLSPNKFIFTIPEGADVFEN